jgi:glycosyltransferase involved in cell wall biosynthesis
MTRVLVVRGHVANPWELAPWQLLPDRYEVSYLQSGTAEFEIADLRLRQRHARTLRDLFPRGAVGDLLVRAPGDRYLSPREALSGADIVHAQELGNWYAAQAAAHKRSLGFKLVLTVWETIPFRDAYRNLRTRRYRRRTLALADRLLPTTQRAADCLLLEGAASDRITVVQPGVDPERFSVSSTCTCHTILSPGRLVWEKGHQDVLRAVAAIRRGIVDAPVREPHVIVVGRGPEERRLAAYANELGISDLVEFRSFVPYDEMASVYAAASCVVLASIPIWSWEEQFGMVLAEAMAAGVPVIASRTGAIPEVCGDHATYFNAGDWLGLATSLAEGPLRRAPAYRVPADPDRMNRFSVTAAAERLTAVYDALVNDSACG